MILSFILHGFGSIKEAVSTIKNLSKTITPTKKVEELAKTTQKKLADIKEFDGSKHVDVKQFKTEIQNILLDNLKDNPTNGTIQIVSDKTTFDSNMETTYDLEDLLKKQRELRHTLREQHNILNHLHNIRLSKILQFNSTDKLKWINETVGNFMETVGAYMGLGKSIFDIVKQIPQMFKDTEIDLNPKTIFANIISWINDNKQKFLANIWYPMWRTLIPFDLYQRAKSFLAPYVGIAVGLTTGRLAVKTLGLVSAIFGPVGIGVSALTTAVATAVGFLGGQVLGKKKVGEALDLFTAYGKESQPYYIEEIEEIDEPTFNSMNIDYSNIPTESISELQQQIKAINKDNSLTKEEKHNQINQRKYKIDTLVNYPTISGIKNLADLQDKLFNQGKYKNINEELAMSLKKKNYTLVRNLMDKITNAKQNNLLTRSLESLVPEFRARWNALLKDERVSNIVNKIKYSETKRSSATQLAYFTKGRANIEFVDEMFLKANLGKMTDRYNKSDYNTTITKTLASNHTTGKALDVTGLSKSELELLGKVSREYGILWGGDIKEWGSWADLPHFEQSNRLLNTYGTQETKNAINLELPIESNYKKVNWIEERYNKLLQLTDEQLLNQSLYTDTKNELTNTLIQSNIAKFALSKEMITLKENNDKEYIRQIKKAINDSISNGYIPIDVQIYEQSVKTINKETKKNDKKSLTKLIIIPFKGKNTIVFDEQETIVGNSKRGVQ